jgi:hypothetical protein
MSRVVNAYARWMLGLSVRDCSGAFRCYRTERLKQIDLAQMRSRGYSYLEELLWMLKQSGARIEEIPIVFTDRQHGQTKINSREALATLWVLLRWESGTISAVEERPLMTKRILLIIPTLDRCGAEKQLTLLACGLPRDRFEVHVCVLTRDGPLPRRPWTRPACR